MPEGGNEQCPHGCSEMVYPVGDPLEPANPYCPDCGHIKDNGCDDGCYFDTKSAHAGREADDTEVAEEVMEEALGDDYDV